MFLDNLDAQTYAGFTSAMSALKTETHFYPGGETDELAAIDAGFGMDMKRTIGNLQTQWLESEDNLAKWCRLICVIFTNFFVYSPHLLLTP